MLLLEAKKKKKKTVTCLFSCVRRLSTAREFGFAIKYSLWLLLKAYITIITCYYHLSY